MTDLGRSEALNEESFMGFTLDNRITGTNKTTDTVVSFASE